MFTYGVGWGDRSTVEILLTCHGLAYMTWSKVLNTPEGCIRPRIMAEALIGWRSVSHWFVVGRPCCEYVIVAYSSEGQGELRNGTLVAL